MGTARRIYKNTLYLTIAELTSKGLQFVVMLYAARILTKEDFGKFSFALALSLMAIIMADIGINTLLVREIARDKKNTGKYFFNSIFIKLVTSILTYILIILFLNLLNYPQETRYVVYAVWIFTIISTFTEMFYAVFRAHEMMFYDAFLKILRMILLAASSLYILFNGYGVFAFSADFIFVEIIVMVAASIIATKKFIKLKLEIDLSFIKEILHKALPFGLAFVLGSIYFFIGSIMLSYLKGDVEVAIYSVAYNIALAILFIPTVYTNAIYPVLSRYFKESKKELTILYERSFKYLYIIGLPISVGLYLVAGRAINLFYGSSYSASIIALQIISWYLFVKFINFLLGTILSSIDQQPKRMIGQGTTSAFNIILNLALIPKYGYIGAAWATFITEIFLFVMYFYYVSKILHFYNFGKILLKPVIAAIAMAIFIKFSPLGFVATVILSSVVYFIIILLTKTFDVVDNEIARKILKNG